MVSKFSLLKQYLKLKQLAALHNLCLVKYYKTWGLAALLSFQIWSFSVNIYTTLIHICILQLPRHTANDWSLSV